jgi:lipoate-protein ligase B
MVVTQDTLLKLKTVHSLHSLPCHFKVSYFGLISYEEGVILQQEVLKIVKSHPSHIGVLGGEHLCVLTRGRRLHEGKESTQQQSPEQQDQTPRKASQGICILGDKEVPVYDADRGGELALHTPGQLMIYPLLNLKKFQFSVRSYIHFLHDVTQLWLASYGVESFLGSQSGLWTSQGKIMFLGLRVQQGLVSHGLAINVHNDLSYYEHFIACGKNQALVHRLVTEKSLKELFDSWVFYFQQGLNTHLKNLEQTSR